MVILVDEKTVSTAEIVAATLKNTLGSKVCILGKPCSGSFEASDESPVILLSSFKLFLPKSRSILYSKKLRKLLTGCRLLPDIRHENMDTIMDKALCILHDPISFSEDPSYERTIVPVVSVVQKTMKMDPLIFIAARVIVLGTMVKVALDALGS